MVRTNDRILFARKFSIDRFVSCGGSIACGKDELKVEWYVYKVYD